MVIVGAFALAASYDALSQVKFGMDVYSHYIWRGADLSAQSLQPSITFTHGNFSAGAWGSFSVNGLYSENDLFAGYTIPISASSIGVSVTDYYVPTFLPPSATFFNYNSKSGSHAVEIGVTLSGGDPFPLTLSGYYNAIGGIVDPDNSSFLQASYGFTTVDSTSISLVAGFTPSKSTAWYTTAKAGVCHIGIVAAKPIKLSNSFSLPVNIQYLLNPYSEKAYLIFGVTLTPFN